jgi:hypothetical protein
MVGEIIPEQWAASCGISIHFLTSLNFYREGVSDDLP